MQMEVLELKINGNEIYLHLYNYCIINRSKNYSLCSLYLIPNGQFTRLPQKYKMTIISVLRPLAIFTAYIIKGTSSFFEHYIHEDFLDCN